MYAMSPNGGGVCGGSDGGNGGGDGGNGSVGGAGGGDGGDGGGNGTRDTDTMSDIGLMGWNSPLPRYSPAVYSFIAPKVGVGESVHEARAAEHFHRG